MRTRSAINSNCFHGLSLVELLIAIGILGVTMMLIAAAFPAGVAMSIAVSDDTTSQSVFQHGLGIVRDNYSVADITDWLASNSGPDLANDSEYSVVGNLYLGRDGTGAYNDLNDPDTGDPDDEDGSVRIGLKNRKYGDSGLFSWSMLLKRMAGAGPMGNLCQAVIVVSRQGVGGGTFRNEGGFDSEIPELRSVVCTGSNQAARTLEIHEDDFHLVPSEGYMIDGETGVAYYIVSRSSEDDYTVTVFSEPPAISSERIFWVVPGEYNSDADRYGRRSPTIRVFQAMLYVP